MMLMGNCTYCLNNNVRVSIIVAHIWDRHPRLAADGFKVDKFPHNLDRVGTYKVGRYESGSILE